MLNMEYNYYNTRNSKLTFIQAKLEEEPYYCVIIIKESELSAHRDTAQVETTFHKSEIRKLKLKQLFNKFFRNVHSSFIQNCTERKLINEILQLFRKLNESYSHIFPHFVSKFSHAQLEC